MKSLLAVPLLWIVAIAAAFADSTPVERFFAQVAGHWQGAGEVRGMASVQQMTWESVLDGRFLRLSFDNRMTASNGKEWHFQAQAFYRVGADGSISGTWFDSRGTSFPLSGSVDGGDTLTILWGTDDTERGRTRYRLTGDGLDVTDEVMMKEGGWRAFGRSQLARRP